MTGRTVSTDQARQVARDLAHTVVQQAEQIAAARALHRANEHGDCGTCRTASGWHVAYPCPTARALGSE